MAVADKIGQAILYLLRHANVAADAKGTIRGTTNPSLDDEGREQTRQDLEFFRDIDLSFIASDDLKRTQQTVLPIADQKGLELEIDLDLRSWDVGPDLENKSIESKRDEIIKLKTQPWLWPVGGQAWGDFESVTLQAFYRYVRRGMESLYPGLVSLHGSSVQVIAAETGFMEKTNEYDQTPMEPSGVAAIYLTRKGLQMRVLRGEKATSDA